uniref:Reverse transcriptase zinc-binding domain-containing protein n=1 Tax=Lactuca sativa TaxID=4236 RepID=A0A9R1VG88_LACSA|nr:hypothetical protein LSAT_V11C500258630 [Lactuca sativa]
MVVMLDSYVGWRIHCGCNSVNNRCKNYVNNWRINCLVKNSSAKVSCFVSRTSLGRIPIAETLLKRGVHINSSSCFCENVVESVDHLRVCLNGIGLDSQMLCDYTKTIRERGCGNCTKQGKILMAKTRNEKYFNMVLKSPIIVADDIISLVYTWYKHRGKNNKCR